MNIDTTVTVREMSVYRVIDSLWSRDPSESAKMGMDKLAIECGWDNAKHMLISWEDKFRDMGEGEEW